MATSEDKVLRQVQSPFLALPMELVLETIAHLSQDRKTLCSLARTCRLVHPICERHIYTTIELLSTDDLQAICHAFAQRPKRIEAVHTLKILYKHHNHIAATIEDRQALNNRIPQMKALRAWHVESPFDNFKWEEIGGNEWVERDMDDFRRAIEKASLSQGLRSGLFCSNDVGLARLEQLTIHSHGASSDFWDLDGFHCLFRHPSLAYLHISCVTLPEDLPQLEPFASTTPLTTLIFDECELEPRSLERILSTPKSLQHLTLGENVANTRRYRGPAPKLTSAPEAVMKAMMPVSHSLKTLTHFDPTYLTLDNFMSPPPVKIKGPGMRDFHQLRLIECDRCSFLHQGILLSHTLAPPNLHTFRLRHYKQQDISLFEELPPSSPYTRLHSLKTLEFVQPVVAPYRGSAKVVADHICDPDSLVGRHAYAYKLWKHGIDMKMHAEMHKRFSYIPPYLHNEPLPQLLLVYDSVELGFYRHVQDGTVVAPHEITDNIIDEAEDKLTLMSPGLSKPMRTLFTSFPTKSVLKRMSTQSKPPETDQLSKDDILRLNNQVRRAVERYQDSVGVRRVLSSVQTWAQNLLHAALFASDTSSDTDSGDENDTDFVAHLHVVEEELDEVDEDDDDFADLDEDLFPFGDEDEIEIIEEQLEDDEFE